MTIPSPTLSNVLALLVLIVVVVLLVTGQVALFTVACLVGVLGLAILVR